MDATCACRILTLLWTATISRLIVSSSARAQVHNTVEISRHARVGPTDALPPSSPRLPTLHNIEKRSGAVKCAGSPNGWSYSHGCDSMSGDTLVIQTCKVYHLYFVGTGKSEYKAFVIQFVSCINYICREYGATRGESARPRDIHNPER